MAEARLGHVQQRDVGLDRLQPGAAALHVQLAAGTQFPARLRELLGVAQVAQGLPRHVELLLHPAQLEVVARHLGGHGDLGIGQAGLFGFQVGTCGLRGATLAAEQVQLPAGIEAQAVALAGRALAAVGQVRLAAAVVVAAGGGVRGLVEAVLDEHRARLRHPRQGDAQVVVGRQRLRHQSLQHRVAELRPPGPDRRFAGEGGIARALQVDRRLCRRDIVRPHGDAAGQQQRGDARGQKIPHHGSTCP